MSKQALKNLLSAVIDKSRFKKLEDFFVFSKKYLEFIKTGLQAEIVAQNETNYRFFQYKKEGYFNISRPINSKLFLSVGAYSKAVQTIKSIMSNCFFKKTY